jgi:uncharacterized membrane protein YdjX (TVP38/TMEM64 family)
VQAKHAEPAPAQKNISLKRLWPIAILAGGLGLFYIFGLDDYLGFESLRDNRAVLLDYVGQHATISALVFALIYIVCVAFSLPGASFLTIAGGLLFGQVLGALYVVVSATIGATILFLIAKTTLGNAFEARMGPWLKKMERGFQDNALSYLLVLRLIPLVPFFVVNLVPAFLGVKLRTFFIATLFGIIPGTFVYAQVGAGLGSIFDSGEAFSISRILTPDIIIALVGLAFLSLIPVIYKIIKARRNG